MARKVHDALFVDGDGASIKGVSSGSHAPLILSQAGSTRKVLGLGASEGEGRTQGPALALTGIDVLC